MFCTSLLSSDASRYLVEVLESVSPSELEDVIEKVMDAVERQPCKWSRVGLCVSRCVFVFTVSCVTFNLHSYSVFSDSVLEYD